MILEINKLLLLHLGGSSVLLYLQNSFYVKFVERSIKTLRHIRHSLRHIRHSLILDL